MGKSPNEPAPKEKGRDYTGSGAPRNRGATAGGE
jgi:hypothetical protein